MNHPVPFWLRFCAWCAVALWATAITVASSMSPRELEVLPFDVWDKAAHFVAFAIGAGACALALRWSSAWRWPRIVFTASVAISAFGALDEYHQTFTPLRQGGDPADWLADTLGAIAGALGTAHFHARSIRPPRLASAGD